MEICLTCKYWDGNKPEMLSIIEKSGDIAMDRFKGWPIDGHCNIDYEWINSEINGDASVWITVDANFGCVYHSADTDQS